jgi:hypothetical protein
VRFGSRPSPSVVDYDLMRKGLSTTSGGSFKMEILGNGQASCNFRGSSAEGVMTAGPNLANNAWHTITCTRSSGSVKLTVDAAVYSRSVTTGTISNSATVYIGAKNTSGEDQYTGLMDLVSVTKG